MNYSVLQARAVARAHQEGGAIERAVLGLLARNRDDATVERNLDAAARDAGLSTGHFVEAVYAAQGSGILRDVEWNPKARTVCATLVG